MTKVVNQRVLGGGKAFITTYDDGVTDLSASRSKHNAYGAFDAMPDEIIHSTERGDDILGKTDQELIDIVEADNRRRGLNSWGIAPKPLDSGPKL